MIPGALAKPEAQSIDLELTRGKAGGGCAAAAAHGGGEARRGEPGWRGVSGSRPIASTCPWDESPRRSLSAIFGAEIADWSKCSPAPPMSTCRLGARDENIETPPESSAPPFSSSRLSPRRQPMHPLPPTPTPLRVTPSLRRVQSPPRRSPPPRRRRRVRARTRPPPSWPAQLKEAAPTPRLAHSYRPHHRCCRCLAAPPRCARPQRSRRAIARAASRARARSDCARHCR